MRPSSPSREGRELNSSPKEQSVRRTTLRKIFLAFSVGPRDEIQGRRRCHARADPRHRRDLEDLPELRRRAAIADNVGLRRVVISGQAARRFTRGVTEIEVEGEHFPPDGSGATSAARIAARRRVWLMDASPAARTQRLRRRPASVQPARQRDLEALPLPWFRSRLTAGGRWIRTIGTA
jgi:hypothetical protein